MAFRPRDRKRKLTKGIWSGMYRSGARAAFLELDRFTYHCKSRRPDQAGLEARIKEICATRVRYR